MVRAFNLGAELSDAGKLLVEELHPNCIEVFYIPSRERLEMSGLDPEEISQHRVKLLLVSGQDDFVTMYPVNTLAWRKDFLKPKYDKIRCISLAGFGYSKPEDSLAVIELLEELPSGFIKDYDFGLGLQKEYRFIIEAVEQLSQCNEIVIERDAVTRVSADDSTLFYISYADFEEARKSVNRIAERARAAALSVKSTAVFNLLATRIGKDERSIKIGRHPISKLVTQVATNSEAPLEGNDQELVIRTLSRNTRAIAQEKPESLSKLQRDIDLVTLEVLIERYEAMLGKKLKEEHWQAFFNENVFILSLAFGYPVVRVKDQASVGGRKICGTGDKITDFLVKNSLTNNTAIFEIKTPNALLLNKTAYREGIYTPSPALSGAINQALDQRYHFQKEVAQLKENSRIYDIESYAVHTCLIIGMTPSEENSQKSFELFRRNSKDVQIVTFNELLEKLRQLHAFLALGNGAQLNLVKTNL